MQQIPKKTTAYQNNFQKSAKAVRPMNYKVTVLSPVRDLINVLPLSAKICYISYLLVWSEVSNNTTRNI